MPKSKKHLSYVRSQPCVVCHRPADHAHHLTHAEARGIGQKVSDFLTVPLCAEHHIELHAFRNEQSYWAYLGIEPLDTATRLAESSPDKREQ